MRLLVGTLSVLLCVAACEKAADKRTANRDAARTPTTCGAGDRKLAAPRAVQCAEQFIARNGYTTVHPSDSSFVVRTHIDRMRPMGSILQQRYNTLQPRAVALCPGPPKSGGFGVAFAAVGPDTVLGSVVYMSPTGSDLDLQTDFVVAGARQGQFGCKRL